MEDIGLSVLGWSRSRLVFRSTAAVTAALFFGLGLTGSSRLPWSAGQARAASSGPNKRVALFVIAKRAAIGGEAKVLQPLMRDELGKLGGVTAIGANGDPVVSITKTAGPLTEAGFRALNERDGALAEERFQKAYKLLTSYHGPFDRRLMARVLKGLGVSSVLTGRASTAERMINGSLNLWPDQQAAEYGWTLDARGAFREVDRKRSEQPLGSVDVTSEPDGVELRVDGALKGFTPLNVEGLTPGPHWFEASADGFARSGVFVDVVGGAGGIAHIDLDPLSDRRVITSALRNVQRLIHSTKVAGPLSNLQRLTIADTVIVLQVDKRRGSYEFSGWIRSGSTAPDKLSLSIPEDADLMGQLGAFLSETLKAEVGSDEDFVALDGPPSASVMDGDSLYIDPNDPIFRDEVRSGGEPITEKWWFWAVAGGVTAALVVGGVMLFSSNDEGSGPSGNVLINLNRLP